MTLEILKCSNIAPRRTAFSGLRADWYHVNSVCCGSNQIGDTAYSLLHVLQGRSQGCRFLEANQHSFATCVAWRICHGIDSLSIRSQAKRSKFPHNADNEVKNGLEDLREFLVMCHRYNG